MKQITITEKDVGEDVLKALKKVIAIRKQRRKAYGDKWIDDPIQFDRWMIFSKYKRLEYIFDNGKNKYEKLEDTLIDLINYSLFMLIKLEKKK